MQTYIYPDSEAYLLILVNLGLIIVLTYCNTFPVTATCMRDCVTDQHQRRETDSLLCLLRSQNACVPLVKPGILTTRSKYKKITDTERHFPGI